MEWVPHTCLFLNPNDSIVKLMCSIVNSVSLWCSPSYKKDVKFWELKKKKKKKKMVKTHNNVKVDFIWL